ncbi:MAG: hypothetical protein ABEI52_05530 [Halobacteriaceae archaeon]
MRVRFAFRGQDAMNDEDMKALRQAFEDPYCMIDEVTWWVHQQVMERLNGDGLRIAAQLDPKRLRATVDCCDDEDKAFKVFMPLDLCLGGDGRRNKDLTLLRICFQDVRFVIRVKEPWRRMLLSNAALADDVDVYDLDPHRCSLDVERVFESTDSRRKVVKANHRAPGWRVTRKFSKTVVLDAACPQEQERRGASMDMVFEVPWKDLYGNDDIYSSCRAVWLRDVLFTVTPKDPDGAESATANFHRKNPVDFVSVKTFRVQRAPSFLPAAAEEPWCEGETIHDGSACRASFPAHMYGVDSETTSKRFPPGTSLYAVPFDHAPLVDADDTPASGAALFPAPIADIPPLKDASSVARTMELWNAAKGSDPGGRIIVRLKASHPSTRFEICVLQRYFSYLQINAGVVSIQ